MIGISRRSGNEWRPRARAVPILATPLAFVSDEASPGLDAVGAGRTVTSRASGPEADQNESFEPQP